MKKLCLFLAMFVFAVACGSSGGGSNNGGFNGGSNNGGFNGGSNNGGSNNGGGFNVAGCDRINVSDLPSEIQSDAYAELNYLFTSYTLWYCTGNVASALQSYGGDFGTYTGTDNMFGYSVPWWENGNEGWGYASLGGGEYLALWGRW